MDMVIITKTDRLVDFSRRLFEKTVADPSKWIVLSPGSMYTHPYLELDDADWEEVHSQVPFVCRRVMMGYMEPGAECIIHMDNHDAPHLANFNILLDSGGPDQCTSYYIPKDGVWDTNERGWVCSDPSELKEVYTYSIPENLPTWFGVDMLHGIENNNTKRRSMIMWLVEAGFTAEDLKKWCDENNIEYEIKFKASDELRNTRILSYKDIQGTF
jgi:hypothetical protein